MRKKPRNQELRDSREAQGPRSKGTGAGRPAFGVGARRARERADGRALSFSEFLDSWHLGSPASGGALVMVLLIVCVLSVVASSMLLTTTSRYHTTFQSASWQEAIVGSEAGVDLAMTELRKRVVGGPRSAFKTADAAAKYGGPAPASYWTVTSPGGTTYPNYGHAFPAGPQPYLLASHGGEGNRDLRVRVYVDVPGSDTVPTPTNFAITDPGGNNSFISQLDNPNLRDPDGINRSQWWYRIRSLGIANVSGPPRPNLEKLDNGLRHLSLFNDWRTGESVATPQVARMVEVLVQPQMNFRNALMSDKRIDLSNQDVLIDSYDSSKGYYDASTNHGNQGNVATNGKLINAGHATVNGNAMTNNGTVNDGDQVSGQQSASFYQELSPYAAGMLNPAWTSIVDGGTLNTDATYVASTDATNPTLVHLDGINLPDGKHIVSLTPPATAASDTPTYLKLYVQGDIKTAGTSYIDVAANVNVVVYFTGNVDLQGNGLINESYLARNVVLNGVQPPANADGTFPDRAINIATGQDFEGVVYAPDHDLTLALTAVPPGGTIVTTTVTAVLDPKTLKKISDLQKNISKNNSDIANAQSNYANHMNDYTQNGNQSSLKAAQDDLKKVADLQGKNDVLQAQIDNLRGTPPKSITDDHARGYNGIYGGFVAKTITVSNKTHVHYDETLRTAGPVNHYQIVNWFEDNVSRDAVGGGASRFWWAGAK